MSDNNASEEFWRAIEDAGDGGGSACIDCDCGRVHFATSDKGAWDSEEEIAEMIAKHEAEPEKYILSEEDGIHFAHFDGRTLVYCCPCGRAKKYEDFIWENRRAIAHYLKAVSRARFHEANRDRIEFGAIPEFNEPKGGVIL